jgi:hypothetical protein
MISKSNTTTSSRNSNTVKLLIFAASNFRGFSKLDKFSGTFFHVFLIAYLSLHRTLVNRNKMLKSQCIKAWNHTVNVQHILWYKFFPTP